MGRSRAGLRNDPEAVARRAAGTVRWVKISQFGQTDMRPKPSDFVALAAFGLAACNYSAPQGTAAQAGGNATLPPVTALQANAAAAGNGLWGVAEAEDEASHRGIDFIVFNRTGRTLIALSLRPDEGQLAPGAPKDPWSANILSQRELAEGQRAAAHYESDIELCRWQIRATFADGQSRDYPGVNLCATIRVDLR